MEWLLLAVCIFVCVCVLIHTLLQLLRYWQARSEHANNHKAQLKKDFKSFLVLKTNSAKNTVSLFHKMVIFICLCTLRLEAPLFPPYFLLSDRGRMQPGSKFPPWAAEEMRPVGGNKETLVYQFPTALDKNNNFGVIHPGIVIWNMGLGKRQRVPWQLLYFCILSLHIGWPDLLPSLEQGFRPHSLKPQ